MPTVLLAGHQGGPKTAWRFRQSALPWSLLLN
jgi:hypothetical protein